MFHNVSKKCSKINCIFFLDFSQCCLKIENDVMI